MKLFSLTEFPREPGLEVAGTDADNQPEHVPKNVVFWAGGGAPFAELDDRLQAIVIYLKQRRYACDFADMDGYLEWQRKGEKWGVPDILQRQALRDMERERVQRILDTLPPTLDGCDPNFPGVKPESEIASRAFPRIVRFAHGADLGPLKPQHVRFFDQPRGFVNWALDINLMTGETIKYPRYIKESGIREGTADEENFTNLKRLLASEAFKNLPAEIPEKGYDGGAWFIEAKTGGSYMWKCHWATPWQDNVFTEIAGIFQRLGR